MARPGPEDVYEQFAEGLAKTEAEVAGYEVAVGHAASMVTSAMHFQAEVREGLSQANGNLNGHRNLVITAIEAAGSHIEARDVLAATMRVRGRSDGEIEAFFGHVDQIEETNPPVAVLTARSGSEATVVYGHSKPPVSMPKDGRDPRVQRKVSIPLYSPTGYHIGKGPYIPSVDIFARQGFEGTEVNSMHPFDRIHFAASADEVGETVEQVVSADRHSPADSISINLLGLPTMVAYGPEAVREFADQVTAVGGEHLSKERLEALNERSLQGLSDVESVILADLVLSGDEQLIFENAMNKAIAHFLTFRRHIGSHSEQLAFLGPLQASMGYESGLVMQVIKSRIDARYVPGTEGEVVAVTHDQSPNLGIEESVRHDVAGLASHGIEVTDDSLETTVREIKEEALEHALSGLSRRKIFEKARVESALRRLDAEA